MAAPLSIQHLGRNYGEHRGIEDVSFEVGEGEIFGFLGPNGAGKSTTIRVLMGLMRPTSGSATIFGLDCWEDRTQTKALIGPLPGDIPLYDRMTVREFLDFMGAFRAASYDLRRRDEVAERLELDLSRRIHQLSRGNRQKVGLVHALMFDAPLLIMDEPTTGLDPVRQADFLDLMREERSRGRTVFLSSHNLAEVERITDRVAIIREGRLVAVEDIDRLRALRERRMQITLSEIVPLDTINALDGVRVVSTDESNGRLELAINGPIRPLLKILAELPVADLTYAPPTLEDVFIHYYEDEEDIESVREAAS